jgi:hypothetical protein
MKEVRLSLLIAVLTLITSCISENQQQIETETVDVVPLYEYRVGLGYGFLGKEVRVMIDGEEVIAVVGTNEIEQFAQLQGTKVLASGSSTKKDITVRVKINEDQSHEQAIDLSSGMFLHVYLEETGLRVYNTRFLVHE